MSGRFSGRLDSLPSTICICSKANVTELASEILRGKGRPSVLVGSGGSSISAEYFRRCRETFSFSQSIVETPMRFVSGVPRLQDYDVWIFSAGAENADVMATVETAFKRGASRVNMITRSPQGRSARRLEELGGRVFSAPVLEKKDGFLATHSLVATVTVLLFAFDALTDNPFGTELVDRFVVAVDEELNDETRARHSNAFANLNGNDTLLVLAEPQLSPISTLIDTSVWEAAICNVQSTDFRNFAHGRHTWLHHRPRQSFVLALTGQGLPFVHEGVLSLIPPTVRKAVFNFGNCGRFENAVGIIKGLALIEAMGKAVRVDPGKTRIGPFGQEIYDDDALYIASNSMVSTIQRRHTSVLKQDTLDTSA